MDRPTILLADDEPDILDSVRFSLEQEGYEVTTAADGQEALDKVREIRPDLIVLDVMMPKENGYRVSHMIREDEEAGRLPGRAAIILLTARNLEGDPDREEMFMKFSRADLMMYKPFDIDDLRNRIQALLKR